MKSYCHLTHLNKVLIKIINNIYNQYIGKENLVPSQEKKSDGLLVGFSNVIPASCSFIRVTSVL